MDNSLLYSKISTLPEDLKKQVSDFIDLLLSKKQRSKKEKKKKTGRGYGSMKGLIKMSKDFDEPLDDFKEYMY